jgi:uncharacterized membrane protein YkvA (DUF1232 family)
MLDFDQVIKNTVDGYEGRHDHLIHQAPALYRLMTHLLEDPLLPGRMRPLVLTCIAYFILPTDIFPEDLQGASGYLDDVYLCAFVANQVRKLTGRDEILTNNWDQSIPILSLIEEILSKEEVLIDDKRELILWYIGYEYLKQE